MKTDKEKRTLKRINEVYEQLGLSSEQVRKYFLFLGSIPTCTDKPKQATFIQYTMNSLGEESKTHARLG